MPKVAGLYLDVRPHFLAHHYEVFGLLSSSSTIQAVDNTACVSIGVIVREWAEWFPAVYSLYVQVAWVWVWDNTWVNKISKAFPVITFINGFTSALPLIDVLL